MFAIALSTNSVVASSTHSVFNFADTEPNHINQSSLEDEDVTPISKSSKQFASSSSNSVPIEIGTIYRWTKNGWEDSSKWYQASYSFRNHWDSIHPIVWSGIVLGLIMLVLFSLSKDSEVEQLFLDLDQFLGRMASENGNPQDESSIKK